MRKISDRSRVQDILSDQLTELRAISSIESVDVSSSGIYTYKLHLSHYGDNSDGLTWETAFTSFTALYAAMSSTGNTLVVVETSSTAYDINTTGDPTFSKTFDIVGSKRHEVKFKNTHASASSVMKLTGVIGLENITVDIGATAIDGVIITGSGSKGSHVDNVYFECEDATGAQTALEVSGGTEYIQVIGCLFHGVQANTKALYVNDCKISRFHDLEIYNCKTGVHLDHADDDQNHIGHIHMSRVTDSITIDAGINNEVHGIHMRACTNHIVDTSGGDNHYDDINYDEKWVSIFPVGAASGVPVASVAGAETYGSLVTIANAAGADITGLFKIVGISVDNSSDAAQNYVLEFTVGATDRVVGHVMFHGAGNKATSTTSNVFTGWLYGGTIVKARLQSETGGSESVEVFLEYLEM